jgi:methyl-accepting chemotaxis protein
MALPRARMQFTLVGRITLLVGIAVVAVGAVSVAAAVASASQADAAHEMARTSDGMSRQWNADMLHDGMRADVLAGLAAGKDAGARARLEVDGVDEHAAMILENFDGAAALSPPALRPEYAATRPDLVEYARTARSLVALSGTDPAAARARVPAFLDLFGRLEEKLGSIDDHMLAAVTAAEHRGDETAGQGRRLIAAVTALAVVVAAGAGLWVVRATRRPLRRLLEGLRRLAGRDLTVRVDVEGRDELAQMAQALNHALTEVGGTIAAAARGAGVLSETSGELLAASEELSRAADDTSTHVGEAATSAAGVGGSVTAMTSATDELSTSIHEIAGQATTAAHIASEAARDAGRTREAMSALNAASREIGDIVAAITTIADQTNLLALNATIEAARAGEAGKGFAVVATEVKELAQETARATDDITAKIDAIQALTASTTELIEKINDVIGRIDGNQTLIAAAVEEQSAVTSHMSGNVAEVAGAAGEISGTIGRISGSTEVTAAVAARTRQNAEQVAQVTGELSSLIRQFTVPAV